MRRAVALGACLAALAALAAPVALAGGGQRAAPPAEPTMGPLISGTVSLLDHTHVWTDYANRLAHANVEVV